MAGTPTFVLGGSGYVAGELLRLLAQHPHLDLAGVLSESQAGTPIRGVFPQLQDCFSDLRFSNREGIYDQLPPGRAALFSAAPHGASAPLVAECLARAARAGTDLTVVDVSADFRYADAADYAQVYGRPHGAPELLHAFCCAVPEHLSGSDRPHIAHPGCFATALLLSVVPLVRRNLVSGDVHAVGITGSTGAGRTPGPNTHHPERHSNLFAYKPLTHRHAPEVMELCEAVAGSRPNLHFIPHSGPFARGIHMTVQAVLREPAHADDLRDALTDFYADCEFVQVRDGTPRIKDVVGSNYCHLGIAADGNSVAVFAALDNLIKGAAGGAVQWMNRQLGWPEHTGLRTPALAWI
jgi:N-acetyl-gamma-glutamyl-phosphate reductase common form